MELLQPGSSLHGFTVFSRTELPEYNGTGIRLIHRTTGLDLFHIYNDDQENFFSFILKTPPRNNHGTAHIVEHAVLAGSRKFPGKDPFLELMKGSAQTFLNAMTYPDKTVFPAASPLRKDYFHLLEVYGDAVFFPLLRREVFLQEGIRIVPGQKGHITFDGIVYNEMRGVYSDHDSIVAERSHRALFPDTPYGLDSGGMPDEIVNLSYEEFLGFHAEFYHPSNCRIFLYGDIPTSTQLEFIEENFLKEFTSVRTDSGISEPKLWDKPASFRFSSPSGEGEGADSKSRGTATLNWLAGSALKPEESVTLEILTELLLGNPGAPLYHAIVESGLGLDLASISGMDPDCREIVFTVGIRGIYEESVPAFETLIEDTLKRLVKEGLSAADVAAAIKRIEFQHRELRGGIPQGLRAMSRAARGWLHGADPELTLQFSLVLEQVKRQLKQHKRYLEKFIESHILNNPHHASVTVFPETYYLTRQNESIQKTAAALELKHGKKLLKSAAEEQKRLQRYHETEDSPEILSAVPCLEKSDMPDTIRTIDTSVVTIDGVDGFRHTFFTNGIAYIDGAFNLEGLSEEELLLIPLFSRLIYMSGTESSSYLDLSRRLTERTGGFYTFLDSGTPVGSGKPVSRLFFRIKMLEADASEAVDLVLEILTRTRLDDRERIRDIISEQISDFSSEFIPSANAFAGLRSGARLRPALALEERWRGISQIAYIQQLGMADDEELDRIAALLQGIRRKVILRSNFTFNITADAPFSDALESFAGNLAGGLPAGKALPVTGELPTLDAVPFETVITASDVAYNSIALPIPGISDPGQPAMSMLANILGTANLWERIRVKGGAYGAHAGANMMEGVFSLSSYRDPRIRGTFADFSAALEDFMAGTFPDQLLDQAVISLVSRELRPLKPRELSMMGFRRALYGITDELRQSRRDSYLAMERGQLIEAAEGLLEVIRSGGGCCVTIAGKDMVQRESRRFPALKAHHTNVALH